MRRLLPVPVIVLLAAGCGGGDETVTVTTATIMPPAKTTVRAYLLRAGKVAPVTRTIARGRPLSAALAGGPSEEERALGFTTAVPDTWDPNDLSRAGLAQIVYTLSQNAPASPVELGRPYTRSDFEDETPAILVESPLPFEVVSSPLRATGTANTFEATFEYELRDPGGKVLADDFVTATSGSGTRGTFDFTIPFEAPDGIGKLVVFERSAADGSRIHQVEIPLALAR